MTADFRKNGGTPYTHDERETQKPVGQDQRLYKIKKPAKPCVATVALNQNMNNQPARNFLTYWGQIYEGGFLKEFQEFQNNLYLDKKKSL